MFNTTNAVTTYITAAGTHPTETNITELTDTILIPQNTVTPTSPLLHLPKSTTTTEQNTTTYTTTTTTTTATDAFLHILLLS